jgi:hypothetical protein
VRAPAHTHAGPPHRDGNASVVVDHGSANEDVCNCCPPCLEPPCGSRADHDVRGKGLEGEVGGEGSGDCANAVHAKLLVLAWGVGGGGEGRGVSGLCVGHVRWESGLMWLVEWVTAAAHRVGGLTRVRCRCPYSK